MMMRKLCLLVGLMGLGWSSGASALPVNNPITAGLVAAYEFSGNADDSSGGGNNGIVVDLPEGIAPQTSSQRAYKEDADPEGGAFGLKRRPYKEVESKLARKHKLRTGVKFHSVVTARDERPIEDGRAAVVFYPSGFVQRTMIQLEDEGTFYTLEIQPMSGRVDVYLGKREADSEFFEIEEDS